ncbi:MAG: glycoside hydrolase family 3 C-terminal domain-containing protein [Bifidobacteriaceae bacterium]|jgi:beta-glucosidase|nr:glycoside hydrolase family 3 C-terminal domain-containing protein [Bifidobacteriaceae bacterium]
MSDTMTRRSPGLLRRGRTGLTLALSVGLVATGVTALNLPAASAAIPAYLDTSLSFDERAADLVSRLTLEEKVLQLNAQTQTNGVPNVLTGGAGVAPAVNRLGVKAYAWWNEALHGVARSGQGNLNLGGLATELPTGLSIASTWNRDLVNVMETVVSDEARAYTNFNNPSVVAQHKGLSYWSPTINMHRDPRWGRAEETYGEDPYLTGEIGKQFVYGMQGADVDGDYTASSGYYKTATTPKHYFANNSETNRHNGSADMTEAEIREYYTPAFAALTGSEQSDGARARSLMTAYNHVNGVPMSGSREYLETFARRTWGFDGVIVSDCDAIRDSWWPGGNGNLWQPDGIPLTQRTGVAYTLKAGTDLDCMDGDYSDAANGLIPAIKDGNITEADIDVPLVRAFRERFMFGEFDNFYADTPWGDLSLTTDVDTAHARAAAKQGAKEATVLLRNDGDLLPLGAPTSASKYVVVGHMGIIPVHGDYSPSLTYNQLLSAQQAVKDYVGAVDSGAQVDYVWGLNREDSQLGRKKPNFGRTEGTGNSVVRFFNSNTRNATTETARVNAETIIKSMDYDGWRGVAPWSGSKTNPSQGYTVLQSYGAWGGYFAVDVDIPDGTLALNVDYAVTQGSTYTNSLGRACRTSREIPGTLTVHLGERGGPVIGTVNVAAPTEVCATNTTDAAPAFSTTLTATLTESVPGRLAALAGSHQKLVFEWDSTYFAPEFSAADEAKIRAADAVIAYTGTTSMQSVCLTNPSDPTANCGAGTGTGGTGSIAYDSSEDEDRSSVDLPRAQDAMISQVAALNPNTIAWIQSVSQVDVGEFKDAAKAIIWTSYNGEFQGLNVPYTVFGKDIGLVHDQSTLAVTGSNVAGATAHVPSGKLPFTWYADVTDLGDAKDYQMTPDATHNGRTYQYFTGAVDYPFGYGLSYATFSYGTPTLTVSGGGSLAAVTPDDTVTVSVPVTNTSATFAGKTVVEVYAKGPRAGEALRPDQQLKGFTKTSEIAPNGTETVTVDIPVKDLWFWDSANDRKVFDTGEWTLLVGSSAAAADQASVPFTLAAAELTPAIENVVAVPDGVVLNTDAPNSAIHANLSATRNDQSFYDLSAPGVTVTYQSVDSSVATVDSTGAVLPAGAGVTTIRATVNANGTTGTTTFPVVVYAGALSADGVTLVERSLDFADAAIPLASAKAGAPLAASLSGTPDASIKYYAATGETNTAGAVISPDGTLRASQAGVVRVTAVTTAGTGIYSHTATVTVTNAGGALPETETSSLVEAIADAQDAFDSLNADLYTPASLAAAKAAIDAAQAVLTNPASTQSQIDAAVEAVAEQVATAPAPRGDLGLITPVVAGAQALAAMASSYTPTSWARVTAAVTAAVAVVAAADPNTTEADVAAAIAAISGAVDGLQYADPGASVTKSLLEALIASAGHAFPAASPYTSASWSAYQAALSAASALVAAPSPSASDLAAARASLEGAIAALVARPSTAPLAAAVDVARAVATSGYTAASVARLASAIAEAGGVLAQAEPSAGAIQSAISQVNAALAALVVAPPAAQPNAGAGQALVSLIDAVTAAAPAADQYTGASWAAYQSALAQARAAGTGDTAAAEAARTALQAAVSGLVPRASTAGLNAAVGAAKAVKPEGYSTASVAALNAAIAAAEALTAPGKADSVTAAEVAAAQTALNAAIAGLSVEVAAKVPTLSASVPKIKGTVAVGKTLKVTKGTWTTGAKFTYRWYANGKAIKGATKASLKLKAAQKGKKITVRVTGKLSGYANVSQTSKATKAVK